MIKVGLSMRSYNDTFTNELRDTIDVRWYEFFNLCNLKLALIPNNYEICESEITDLQGIVLSGGEDINQITEKSSIRDKVEKHLIQRGIECKIPIIGVCRGMQIIQNFFGINLFKIDGHIKVRHELKYEGETINVNSFHNYGTKENNKHFNIDAKASDGVIKAISHIKYPIKGIMWHPEREKKFSDNDILLFKTHFKSIK